MRAKSSKRPARRKTVKKEDSLFTSKSELATIDLVAFFSDEKVWHGLKNHQKSILKSLCPADTKWGQCADDQPNLGLLMFDMHWKSDLRMFKEDLLDGYYETEFVEDAGRVTEERKNGKFDQWKLNKFEAYWGQKMEQDKKLFEERRQQVSITELFTEGLLKTGDKWLYSRSFGRGKKTIVVEYEIEMCRMDEYGTAEFRVEIPGVVSSTKRALEDDDAAAAPTRSSKRLKSNQRASTANATDAVVVAGNPTQEFAQDLSTKTNPRSSDSAFKEPIDSKPTYLVQTDRLQTLEQRLLVYDGRRQKPGKVDSWQYFAVRRGSTETGRLADLRDQYWEKRGKPISVFDDER